MITLTKLGSFQPPFFGSTSYNKHYPQIYQLITNNGDKEDELFITWGLKVGLMTIPTLSLTRPYPIAQWVKQPVGVGAKYIEAVKIATTTTQTPNGSSHWAELRGIAYRHGKIWCNYGQYYHVTPADYDNLNSIDESLDKATESQLYNIEPKYNIKTYAGAICAAPDGWFKDYSLLRDNYWLQGSDYGPMVSITNPDIINGIKMPFTRLIQYSSTNKYPGWSSDDTRSSIITFTKTIDSTRVCECCGTVLPNVVTKKYVGLIARKGTAPGWYGGQISPDGIVDKCSAATGRHAYPYQAQMIVYDVDDMNKSLDLKLPQQLTPVTVVDLGFGHCANVGGAIVVGNKLYVLEVKAYKLGTTPETAYTYPNLVHCYEIA